LRRSGVNPPYRFHSFDIRQPEAEQDDVKQLPRKMSLGTPHVLDMSQVDFILALLAEHLAKQTGILPVILDQENRNDQFRGHSFYPPRDFEIFQPA